MIYTCLAVWPRVPLADLRNSTRVAVDVCIVISSLSGLARPGTDMYEDSWFQLEGAAWRPFRHPIDAVRHGFNFMQYKLRQSQVGRVDPSYFVRLSAAVLSIECRACDAHSMGTKGWRGSLV